MKRNDSRSPSSCAACKLLKRKCVLNCIFAPYFESDEMHKFAKIHKVFGASNASKILSEVPQDKRRETVKSLVYEAEARLNDPVYGCIGTMLLLQNRMVELQHDLDVTRAHLASYAINNNTSYHENYVGSMNSLDLPQSMDDPYGSLYGH
ncbi:LOB domain-containing protein 21 [Ranunculus cassubicifolius]